MSELQLVPIDFKAFLTVNLDEVEKEYSEMPDTSTDDGYKVFHERRMTLVKSRTGLEKIKKEKNAEAKAYIDTNNANVKEILAKIEAIEAPYKQEKKRLDDEAARVKREAEEREARRVSKIQARINDIQAMGTADVAFRTSAELAELLKRVESIDINFGFDEFIASAAIEKDAAIVKINEAIEKTKAQEKEAERVRIAAEELEKQKEELRLEQERIDKENAEKQAVIDAENKRIAEEQEKKQRKIDSELAEIAAFKAEKLAKERAEEEKLAEEMAEGLPSRKDTIKEQHMEAVNQRDKIFDEIGKKMEKEYEVYVTVKKTYRYVISATSEVAASIMGEKEPRTEETLYKSTVFTEAWDKK